ncbi:MAG TPA: TA system VapC family ribonuclease toxin [Thermoanaerobaculia bacterium]|nr:TA system VapC family ribonuclease toxin [Thermoanaerobaculia bacterium]
MIAVDSNLLVYAHRRDSEWHEPARREITSLAESAAAWAIPWPCLYEFYAIVTHPGIYRPPTSPAKAIDQIEAWLESPSLVLLAETGSYSSVLADLLRSSRPRGPKVHDACIAALCVHGGARELLSADRDFSRFPALATRNPLV